MDEYFIVDLRPEVCGKYITFWRPNNSNYAWPLPWAGKYSQEAIDSRSSYYCVRNSNRQLIRFPVLCEAVREMAESPDRGDIDGDVGPVVRDTRQLRRRLKAQAYLPKAKGESP